MCLPAVVVWLITNEGDLGDRVPGKITIDSKFLNGSMKILEEQHCRSPVSNQHVERRGIINDQQCRNSLKYLAERKKLLYVFVKSVIIFLISKRFRRNGKCS